MDNRYHQPWDRQNFEFHRKDPKPWIPFEDEPSRFSIDWKIIGYWLLSVALLFGLPALVRWFPI